MNPHLPRRSFPAKAGPRSAVVPPAAPLRSARPYLVQEVVTIKRQFIVSGRTAADARVFVHRFRDQDVLVTYGPQLKQIRITHVRLYKP